jgi:hypothetical protein
MKVAPMESKKMAGMVGPRIMKKRTVAGFWDLVPKPVVPTRVPVDGG